MKPAIMGLLAVLALIAMAYFAYLAWRADALADVLMRRGYAARGWTQARLSARMRLLGIFGVLVAVAAVSLALTNMVA
jgi:hypothetical protein